MQEEAEPAPAEASLAGMLAKQLKLGQAGRLGWTTWLGTRTQPGDAEDVVLSSTAAA